MKSSTFDVSRTSEIGLRLLSLPNRNYTKTDIVVANVRGDAVAIRRTHDSSIVAPRATTQHSVQLHTTQTGAAIGWRAMIGLVIPIFTPLPNVAMHVKEAPGIRLLLSGVVGSVLRVLCKPRHLTQVAGIISGHSGATGILPFSLSRQAICKSIVAFVEFADENLRVIPGHLLNRQVEKRPG